MPLHPPENVYPYTPPRTWRERGREKRGESEIERERERASKGSKIRDKMEDLSYFPFSTEALRYTAFLLDN